MEMFRLALVLGAFLVGCDAGLLSSGEQFVEEYAELNDYLVKTVQTDDVTENMEAATKWVPSLKGSQQAAVKQFLDLQGVVGADKCDKHTMDVIVANFAAIGPEKHYWPTKPEKRVDKLVVDFALKHAQVCRQQYPKLVRKKVDEMGAEHFESIWTLAHMSLMDLLEDTYVDPSVDNYAMCAIRPSGEEYMLDRHLVVLEALKEVAIGDPDHKYLVESQKDENSGRSYYEKEKVIELFEKYIYKPCLSLDENIATPLLEPMKYDLDILDYHKECENIMSSRMALGICHHIVRHRDIVVAKLIADLTDSFA